MAIQRRSSWSIRTRLGPIKGYRAERSSHLLWPGREKEHLERAVLGRLRGAGERLQPVTSQAVAWIQGPRR